MELQNPNNGENHISVGRSFRSFSNGEPSDSHQSYQFFNDEFDSTCSTPYVSAPSSPGRYNNNGYFFSAPASPMHFVLSSSAASLSKSSSSELSVSGSFEFEFSAKFPDDTSSITAGSMSSADELFLNGQIRPMKLSSHLQRPQILAPLLDLDVEDEEDEERKELGGLGREDSMVRGREIRLRNRSLHRRARSMSPLRSRVPYEWHEEVEENHEDQEEREIEGRENEDPDLGLEDKQEADDPSTETTPSVSASTSRSSSGRNSKRWIFLKDFLRSKSEGRGNAKEKFWNSISFSPVKEKKHSSISKEKLSSTIENSGKAKPQSVPSKKSGTGKPRNGVGKRRIPPSPHELLYTANRAQAEEMKKKTYLPYRQGLLGCLGFSSKGYGAMNVFARSLNPVSSR